MYKPNAISSERNKQRKVTTEQVRQVEAAFTPQGNYTPLQKSDTVQTWLYEFEGKKYLYTFTPYGVAVIEHKR